MDEYFYGRFRNQLAGIKTYRTGESIYHCHDDPDALFVGVNEWEDVNADLATIPEEDRPLFILSFFMVILTDQALHARFNKFYEPWRKQTRFPKFGARGMTHSDNPFLILWVPERDWLVNPHSVIDLIPEFADFYLREATTYFQEHLPDVGVQAFFDKVKGDPDYSFSHGTIVPRVKANFGALTRLEVR